MRISDGLSPRHDRTRRIARSRPGVVVESLEGRQLLSHMGSTTGHHDHQVAMVSSLDDSSGHNQGGEVRKDPHYFEIFDNIGNRPDLNVVRASVKLHEDRTVLTFSGEMQGKINASPATASQNSLYVFGVNRGSPNAIAPFALRPGVKFDAVVVVSINNVTGISASVVDIVGGTRTSVTADHVHIHGREVSVDIDPALLPTPTGGVSIEHDTFNLWPREGNGPDTTIASFIPENSMAPITVEGHHHGG